MTTLKWGMIGGGEGSQIGPAHRMATAVDGLYSFVAGALDVDPHRGRDSGRPAAAQAACLKCHQAEECGEQVRLPEPVRTNCTGCHSAIRSPMALKRASLLCAAMVVSG